MIAVLAAIAVGGTAVPVMAAAGDTPGREGQAAWSKSNQVTGEAPTLTDPPKPESAGGSEPLLGFGLVGLSFVVLLCRLSAQGGTSRGPQAGRDAHAAQTT